MKLQIGWLTLDYDRKYGIDKRSGWSVAISGSYLVQFWPDPVTAILYSLYINWKNHRA